MKSPVRLLSMTAGLAAGAYTGFAALTWSRYGHAPRPWPDEADPLLDQFMPVYEVVERHHVRVAAPAAVTLAAASEQDIGSSPLIRAIFAARALVLGADPTRPRPQGLLAEVQSLGWGVLADVPGREVVVGAVTKPWEPAVTFHALPREEFAKFSDPGFVKIAWTLRADPVGPDHSIFRTETRAMATDAVSRARFRRYWTFVSPGVWLIRTLMLGPVRREAERRARQGGLEVRTAALTAATPRAEGAETAAPASPDR